MKSVELAQFPLLILPQVPCLFNDTIKQNITLAFDEEIDCKALDQAIWACSLDNLSMERTVGSHGSCLSGGERRKVALARLYYQLLMMSKERRAAAIVILNDPFCSLDQASASHIREHCIGWIETEIYQLTINGKNTMGPEECKIERNQATEHPIEDLKDTINYDVKTKSLLSESRNILGLILGFVSIIPMNLSRWCMDVSLAFWMSNAQSATARTIYVANCIGLCAATLLHRSFCAWEGVSFAHRTFNRSLAALVNSSSATGSNRHLGILLGFFTKDTETVDMVIAETTRSLAAMTVTVGLTLVFLTNLQAAALTRLLPVLIFLMVLLGLMYRPYRRAIILAGQAEGLARGRLAECHAEAMSAGHEFQMTDIMTNRQWTWQLRRFHKRLDEYNRWRYILMGLQRWLNVRTDMIGVALVFWVGLWTAATISPANYGLGAIAVGRIHALATMLCWYMRQAGELEGQLVALRRLASLHASHEHAMAIITLQLDHLHVQISCNGPIRSSDAGPVLLNGPFQLALPRGQWTALSGPNGSGKSTLAAQIVLAAVDGAVVLVPQDAPVWSGSLYENIDPGNLHKPECKIRVVGWIFPVQQHHHMENIEIKINLEQRQRIGLARGLLKCMPCGCGITRDLLILDEPTSAFNEAEETRLLNLFQSHLPASTAVLLISHGQIKRLAAANFYHISHGQLEKY